MYDAGSDNALRPAYRRWLPLLLLALFALALYASGLHRYLGFRALAEHRDWLLGEVAALGLWAAAAFVLFYAAAAAVSIPGALFLSVLGGFLFGTVVGAVCDLAGATIGATAVFLVARGSLGPLLRQRAGPFLVRLESGFRRNAVSYLLVLRLVPIFPFFVVNLVAAFLGVRLRVFVLCTLFGMAPGALIYASIGAGLGGVLDRGEMPDLGAIVFEPHFLLPLLALALLASVPVFYRRRAPSQ